MQVDQQGPPNTAKQGKSKLRTLKDAYKSTKDNNMKTETVPMTYPYNGIGEVLSIRDTVKLTEVCEAGVNEDDHINPSGSITMDTGNPAIILKADGTHHEEKDAIRKELILLQITVKERWTRTLLIMTTRS